MVFSGYCQCCIADIYQVFNQHLINKRLADNKNSSHRKITSCTQEPTIPSSAECHPWPSWQEQTQSHRAAWKPAPSRPLQPATAGCRGNTSSWLRCIQQREWPKEPGTSDKKAKKTQEMTQEHPAQPFCVEPVECSRGAGWGPVTKKHQQCPQMAGLGEVAWNEPFLNCCSHTENRKEDPKKDYFYFLPKMQGLIYFFNLIAMLNEATQYTVLVLSKVSTYNGRVKKMLCLVTLILFYFFETGSCCVA